MVVGAAFLAGIAITANADPLCRCEGSRQWHEHFRSNRFVRVANPRARSLSPAKSARHPTADHCGQSSSLRAPQTIALRPLEPVIVVVPMINWPEIFRDVEHWAGGFLAGAAAGSLVAIAVAAIVLLARVT